MYTERPFGLVAINIEFQAKLAIYFASFFLQVSANFHISSLGAWKPASTVIIKRFSGFHAI